MKKKSSLALLRPSPPKPFLLMISLPGMLLAVSTAVDSMAPLSTGPGPITLVVNVRSWIWTLAEQTCGEGGQMDYFPASPPSNTVDYQHLLFFKTLNCVGLSCCYLHHFSGVLKKATW